MKSEQQIKESLSQVGSEMEIKFNDASFAFMRGEYDECMDLLYTLLVNVAAIEAGKRVLED